MPEPLLRITDPDNVPVTFISDVGGVGFLNGVINVTFVTARWTPDTTGPEPVRPDLIISSRLRMDLFAAQQLRDHLTKVIEQNTKPMPKAN